MNDSKSAALCLASSVDSEVPAKPQRRSFTAEYKKRILEEVDAATKKGAVGAIMRRERIYSSTLSGWRATSTWMFTTEDGARPASIFTLDTQHSRIRASLNEKNDALELPADFLLHSLRHTFLTRMGEAGADAFTIMRLRRS